MRTPAQWLAEYAASHDFKEITQKEFDTMCETGIAPSGDAAATTGGTAALEPQQREIQTTPADADGGSGRLCPVDASAPVIGGPMTQDLAGIATGQAMPSFDFSPLGALAEQAADADQQFDLHYGTAQDEYLVSCIYLARIHALTAKAGRYGGGTWTKWYESKGLSEGSARTMVKNGDAFNSATVAELKQLPNLTRKDLNLIARSGCADQVVAAAGDSHRVQALLAQLKAERERADNAEERAQAAQRSAELDAKELQRLDKLTTHYKAENDRRAADQQRLEGLNATLVQEMAEKTARIQELEARPVEVTGATEKEIARWKAEGAKAERDKAQKERDKAALREAALRKELTDLREDNEQVSTEMLALQSELCELRRQTDQGQGDPAAPTRYAAAACQAILLPELERIAPEPSKRVDASYMMEYRMLLREALMGGMPDDYAGTAQNPYRISLTKPAVAFGGRFDPDEFDDGTYMAFTAREEPRDRCLILRCTGPELDAIQRYCDVLHVNYKEKELKNG